MELLATIMFRWIAIIRTSLSGFTNVSHNGTHVSALQGGADCRMQPIPDSWFGFFASANQELHPYSAAELKPKLSRKESKNPRRNHWLAHREAARHKSFAQIHTQIDSKASRRIKNVAHTKQRLNNADISILCIPLLCTCFVAQHLIGAKVRCLSSSCLQHSKDFLTLHPISWNSFKF